MCSNSADGREARTTFVKKTSARLPRVLVSGGDMTTYRIAVIAGDGIGQEVMPEGIKVLRTLPEIVPGLHLEFEEFPWGSDHYQQHGVMMPESGLKMLAEFDAIYFGA